MPSSARPTPSAGLSLFFRIVGILFGSVRGYCIFSLRERDLSDCTHLLGQHAYRHKACLFFSILCIIFGSRCGYRIFSLRKGGLVCRSIVSACSPYIPNASEPITLFFSARLVRCSAFSASSLEVRCLLPSAPHHLSIFYILERWATQYNVFPSAYTLHGHDIRRASRVTKPASCPQLQTSGQFALLSNRYTPQSPHYFHFTLHGHDIRRASRVTKPASCAQLQTLLINFGSFWLCIFGSACDHHLFA